MTPAASSSSSSLVKLLSIISLLATTTAAFEPILTICSGDNHTILSPYASNLRRTLANLIATTPNSPSHLFTNHFGKDSTSDSVFSIAECREDASPTMCADCLTEAADAGFNGTCAGRRSATVRYDYCLLRYADHFFYSDPQNFSFTHEFKPESAISPASFKTQVGKMLDELVAAAAVGISPLFAVAKTTYAPVMVASREIYGLAWCTMLPPEDCYNCLNRGLQGYRECCSDQIGGWVATESCIVAYDDQPFFNLSLLQSPAPAPGGGEVDIVTGTDAGSGKINLFLIIGTATLGILAVVLFCVIIIQRRKRGTSNVGVEEDMGTDHESLRLPFASLKAATNSFSNENKLGEGRFGPAYKGVLDDGRQIVVNRLTKCSEKGLSEMRREVNLVAQLQHINLVKLFGYCVQNKEQLLVYEYLPNASLDEHLFDSAMREKLDWKKRHTIIKGIARGLVYLHNHSRHKIIHRDLNAKNILLDDSMIPKISDFGLAKLVGGSESQLNTKLIAGTFGYMSPEYATRGFFSTKSDVFSYGMVVLEVITGRRNCSFVQFGDSLNLQTFVWQKWNGGEGEEVIDEGLRGQYQMEEVMRCLNIGLLCVQDIPAERPSMSTVMLFLSSDTNTLPAPSVPGFFTGEYPPGGIVNIENYPNFRNV